MTSQILVPWLRQLVAWLKRSSIFFVAIIPVIAVTAIARFSGWTEGSFRLGSTLLQVVGLWGILRAILDTRRQFGQMLLSRRLRKFLAEFPLPQRRQAIIAVGVAAQAGNVSAASATIGTLPAQDVESRLAEVERQFLELRTTVANHYGEVQEKHREQVNALEHEAQRRVEGDQTNYVALERTTTGGLDLSLVGLLWLLVGAIYGTQSIEVSSTMQRWFPPPHSVLSRPGPTTHRQDICIAPGGVCFIKKADSLL
jgi:hypothetical protein